MTDVILTDTLDGGQIDLANGQIQMDGGLSTFFYLCLSGGNVDDPAWGASNKEWWGNLIETDENRKYRSRTQYLLKSGLPIVSANLVKLRNAVEQDCAVALSEGVVDNLTVKVSVVSKNRVKIEVVTESENLVYFEEWV